MPTDITTEQRAELRRLHEAATKAPWEYYYAHGGDSPHTVMGPWSPDSSRTSICHTPWKRPREESTMRLIAAARNALPALLDAADERDVLRERLAEVTADRDALLRAAKVARQVMGQGTAPQAFDECECYRCSTIRTVLAGR